MTAADRTAMVGTMKMAAATINESMIMAATASIGLYAHFGTGKPNAKMHVGGSPIGLSMTRLLRSNLTYFIYYTLKYVFCQ